MNKIKLVKLDFHQTTKLFDKKELADFKCAPNAFDFDFFKQMGFELDIKKTNVYSVYVIYCPIDELAIGVVAFKKRKDDELEIVYMLDEKYRQKGYAKVAVGKALKEIKEEKIINKIVAYVPKDANRSTILTENQFEVSNEFEKFIEWQLLNGFY